MNPAVMQQFHRSGAVVFIVFAIICQIRGMHPWVYVALSFSYMNGYFIHFWGGKI